LLLAWEKFMVHRITCLPLTKGSSWAFVIILYLWNW
jgi:hypothetical protein